MNSIKSDFITIETHFGVPGHFIRAHTRNRCSEDTVAMLQEIAKIVYPLEEFEIFLLPPQPGSYTDIVKFVKKHKVRTAIGATIGTSLTVGGLYFVYLNYKDTHEKHVHETAMNVVDDTAKCLALKQALLDLDEEHTIENVSEEKINEVCKNLTLKKKKNDIFDTLSSDDMVESNETLLKDSNNETLASEVIEREEFSKYNEPIQDEKYEHLNATGIIELISPVVKQKREGRGIAWRGTYYGDDILYETIVTLKNGEDVDFFMQDQDLKSQINNKQRVFAQGDNMKVVFDMSGEIKGNTIINRNIYIKEVQSYNEETVHHKDRLSRQAADSLEDHPKLFDGPTAK